MLTLIAIIMEIVHSKAIDLSTVYQCSQMSCEQVIELSFDRH